MAEAMIDIHTHIGVVRSWSRYLFGRIVVTLEDLLGYMDAVGVSAAALLPLPGPSRAGSRIASTERVLRAAERCPGRVVPFCAVDPRAPNAEDLVKRYVRRGCRGFGEYKVEMRVDHPLSVRLYKLCAELAIPVLIHMDSKYNPDVRGLVRVLEEVPDAKFIMHGPGWWKHISAVVEEGVEYPSGRVVPGGMVERIMSEHENVYADISAFSGLNALRRDPEYAKRFLERFSGRVLYGTDFPCVGEAGNQYGPNREHLDLLLSLGLSKQALERILYRNAAELLGVE